MALTEKQLKQRLEQPLDRLYLLYGDEGYLVSHYTDKIVRLAVDDDVDGFNFHKFEGDTADMESVFEAVEALPLMAQRKCVLVRDLDVPNAEVAEALLDVIADPPETTVLVLSYANPSIQPKKSGAWKKVYDTAEKVGTVVCFAKKTAGEVARILCSGAVRRGCTLTPKNAEMLVEQCGNDMLLLTQELDKLAAIANGGEITAHMIDTVATKNLEAKVFDLSKAILRHDRDRAFSMLQTLLQNGDDAVPILSVLSGAYVDMYRMKVAAETRHTGGDVAAMFPATYKGKDFRLRYAASDARGLSIEALQDALDILAQADTQLKSSRTPSRVVLEETLVKLL